MKENTKRIGMLIFLGVMLLVVVLSAGLDDLELQPGEPFPWIGNSETIHEETATYSFESDLSLPLLQGVLALTFIALMIFVPVRMMAFLDLGKLLKFVGAIAVLVSLLILLPDIETSQPASMPVQSTESAAPVIESFPTESLGQPPQPLVLVVSILAGAGLIFLVVMLIRQIGKPPEEKDQLLQEAEAALNALQSGEDLSSVIIRCYLEMAQSLQAEQGLDRNEDMTVREFESLLAGKGFPTAPVRNLTALFEKVRYSQQPVSVQDEQAALESLGEIIRFSTGRSGNG